MNLLRKNLGNQSDKMAKRVKKLIRKWKQEIDKIKLENTNGIANDSVNRISSPLPNSDVTQTGVKRKINQYNQVNGKRQDLKQRTSSPKVASPNIQRIHQSSPSRNRVKSPHPIGSPKLLSKDKLIPPRSHSSPNLSNVSNSTSPGTPSNSKSARNTLSPLVTNNTDKIKIEKMLPRSSVDSMNVKKNGSENGIHVNNLDSNNKEQFDINNKDSDTRVQENRIPSMDSGYQGDEHSPNESSQEDERFLPIEKPTNDTQSIPDLPPIPDSFEPIEEEDLEVTRKDFTENPSSPSILADGVNGTYDANDTFCNWTDEIAHGEFSVLPYIILD